MLRGTTVNAYGDKIDANTAVYEHVPATLLETSKAVQDPSTQTPRTIRQIQCWVPNYLGVTTDDRILDEASGDTFIIYGILIPPSLISLSLPVRLDLKRVTANAG